MDKNTWIGFGLIAVIIIVFMKCSGSPDPAPTLTQHQQDSIRAVKIAEQERINLEKENQRRKDSIAFAEMTPEEKAAKLQQSYGTFAASVEGEEKLDTLENGKVRIVVSTKGGVIKQAELLEYTSALDKEHPLRLFDDRETGLDKSTKFDKESYFSAILRTNDNIEVPTAELYFTQIPSDSNKIVMRLNTTDPEAWLDFEYELTNNYMVHYRIRAHNLQNHLNLADNKLPLDWRQFIPQHEKGRSFEERYAGMQFMYNAGGFGGLGGGGEIGDKGHFKWIAYKDQFFSTFFIADTVFQNSTINGIALPPSSGYMRAYRTRTHVPFDVTGEKAVGFRFYFGPNHYNTLKSYGDIGLQYIIPLGGWKIVPLINRLIVIPLFDLFMRWGLNIGLVIILLTLVIKLIILPFVFASYKSSAKMKALRPQLNEINEKYPAEKMAERQRATMELYRQAGVSPMSGCLPMLFQFPVLMAMFWFFPTAIELRGRSFLWADDLSTYDNVINFGTSIPLLGDHLSLFCLLMTIANIAYTYVTMQSQNTDPSMKFMKYIMYAMPIMFLFIFNDYAAGLSFYYLVSLFITILQTMIFRWTLNDQKMLAEIEENKKKRAGKPKSRFMQRLEAMQREQERLARERAKKGARR